MESEETLVLLEHENEAQQRFREDMEKAGLRVVRYSGRGMFGAETYAVSCKGARDTDNNQPDEQAVHRATVVHLRAESLGYGSILYV